MYNPQLIASTGFDSIARMIGGAEKGDVENQLADSRPVTEFLSLGSGRNEIGSSYTYGDGTHNIRMFNLVSPDIMLVHQSRLVGFYRKMNDNSKIETVTRDIKNLLVKDTRY